MLVLIFLYTLTYYMLETHTEMVKTFTLQNAMWWDLFASVRFTSQ